MSEALLRDDYRRQLTLWVLLTAETTGISPTLAFDQVQEAFVAEPTPADLSERTPFFAVERTEDYLPSPRQWADTRNRVHRAVTFFEQNQQRVDAMIVAASPKWRLERMPLIDRTILRMGVAELLGEKPRPRATLNGMIELAKLVGGEGTPAFVNGILDQIRRNLNIPFAP